MTGERSAGEVRNLLRKRLATSPPTLAGRRLRVGLGAPTAVLLECSMTALTGMRIIGRANRDCSGSTHTSPSPGPRANGRLGATCDSPPARLSARCRIGQETFAGVFSLGGPAPIPNVRSAIIEPFGVDPQLPFGGAPAVSWVGPGAALEKHRGAANPGALALRSTSGVPAPLPKLPHLATPGCRRRRWG
jgi:hypothetical protein